MYLPNSNKLVSLKLHKSSTIQKNTREALPNSVLSHEGDCCYIAAPGRGALQEAVRASATGTLCGHHNQRGRQNRAKGQQEADAIQAGTLSHQNHAKAHRQQHAWVYTLQFTPQFTVAR